MSARTFGSKTGRVPFRVVIAVAIAAILGTGAYAFTASNTVANSTAGSGVGTVSGYTVSGIHYSLNATTPANIDSLNFTVSPVIPSTGGGKVIVQAALTSGGPTTYTAPATPRARPSPARRRRPQLLADKLTSLTVIAAQ